MQYRATQESNGSLAFYGTALRIERLGDHGQLESRTVDYGPTIRCKRDDEGQSQGDGAGSYLAPDTTCPAGRALGVNQRRGKGGGGGGAPASAATATECVPSPFADCPQSSDAIDWSERKGKSRRAPQAT